jgi:catechol 2,3-dioxygenase-like lactoylglutathione lyase family enzyme
MNMERLMGRTTIGAKLSRRDLGVGIAAGGLALAAAPFHRVMAAGPAAPYAADIQSLGWWMRRTTGRTMAELTPYYQRILGLPLVRAWENDLVLLWAGEDLIFEVKTDDSPKRQQPDPDSAAMVPVFRVHDLARWQARMTGFGYAPVSQRRSRYGRTIFYRGPDNLVTGFEERAASSPLKSDRRALRNWRAGPFRLGGLPPLPDTLHYLSRAIRHVADVAAMARFYRDNFGLQPLGREGGSQIFALGYDSVLEIAPGGVSIPEPADRSELPDTFVLRTHNLDAQRAALPRRGARLKGELIVKEETTRLQFVADPEGWIVGVEERGKIRSRYIDDVEADRRWRARGNAGATIE